MQDIDLLMKSINELEFLVAYQKHVITTSKCTCDSFMDNLRELYRVYTNSKYLTNTLKNGINKFHAENIRLQNLLFENKIASDAELTAVRLNERRIYEQQQHQQQQCLISLSSASPSTTTSSMVSPQMLQNKCLLANVVDVVQQQHQPFNYLLDKHPQQQQQPIATSSLKSSPNNSNEPLNNNSSSLLYSPILNINQLQKVNYKQTNIYFTI